MLSQVMILHGGKTKITKVIVRKLQLTGKKDLRGPAKYGFSHSVHNFKTGGT